MSPAHHQPDIAALQDRLTRLSQASLNINESLDLDDVFRKVLDSARSLTGAHYGVITTINDAGHNNAFLSSGTTPEEHRRLAEMPERHQLFGYLSRLSSPMRVDDFQSHTRSLGMSEFSPLLPVRAFSWGLPSVTAGPAWATSTWPSGTARRSSPGRMRRPWSCSPPRAGRNPSSCPPAPKRGCPGGQVLGREASIELPGPAESAKRSGPFDPSSSRSDH